MNTIQTKALTFEERRQKITSLRALIEQKMGESNKMQKSLDITPLPTQPRFLYITTVP